MVTKTMSSNEAKQNWGSVIKAASGADDAVIVESHGKPKAAVISIERFEKLRELEQQEKRAKGLALLRRIEESYDGRNDDLSDDQIEELANRFSRDFVDDLVAEGKITFETPEKR